MSEVSKIDKVSASSAYENLKKGKTFDGENIGTFFLRGEVWACNQMARICDELRADYANVIKDENDYLEELESLNLEIDNQQQTLEEKIKALQNEIEELKKKLEDDTATDEEKEELSGKLIELNSLRSHGKSEINSKLNEFNNNNAERRNLNKNKAKIAEDYGETTIEKGTPLAETKVSHGFFKKLFGTTGKNKKEAGERAVEAGNALLDKVNESEPIEADINAFSKKR